MASDFTKKYLQLRQKQAGTAAPAASVGQGESTKEAASAASSGGDSFTSRYLSIRNSRNGKNAGGALPSPQLVSPLSFTQTRSAAGTDRSYTKKTAQTLTDRLTQAREQRKTSGSGRAASLPRVSRTARSPELEEAASELRRISTQENIARRSRGFSLEDAQDYEAQKEPLRRRVREVRDSLRGEPPGFGEWLGQNAAAGLSQFNQGIASTLDFFLPTELVFGEENDPISRLNRYYTGQRDAWGSQAAEVNEDKGGAYEAAGQLLQGVTGSAPSAILAAMTGGASLAAQGTTALTGAAGSAAAGLSGLGSTIAAAGQTLARNPMFWTSMLQTVGPAYDDARADGAGELEATASALITGLLNSAVEIGGGIESLPAEVAQGGESAVRRWVKSMLEEGREEVVQGAIQSLTEKAVYDRERPWASLENEDAVLNPARAAEEFVGGAVAGGVLGGAQIGALGIADRMQNPAGRGIGGALSAMGDEVVQATIREGLDSDPSTESYRLARQLQRRAEAGETIPDAELGRLYQANVQAIEAEESSGGLLLRAAEEAARNGRVSNRTAGSILGNPSAVSTLSAEAGLALDDTMSQAQRRAAVKRAVEALARPATATAGQSMGTDTTGAQTDTQRPAARRVYDAGRLRGISSALGENGAKALNAVYDGSADADRFYAGFAAYYQAGVSGRSIDSVRSDYAGQLSSAQQFAAYSAGQNDAEASLAAERERVPYATVYGSESGFIPNEHSAGIDQETTRFYNDLARATGTRITIAAATGAGDANGWYRDGTIYIAADAENAGQVVAKHEITHRLQEIAPEEYRAYRDYAVNALSEQYGSSAALVERYRSRYAAAGQNLTVEQAMDEIAADFTAQLTIDPARFERLAQDNRSVARRVLDALRDFIRRVKSLFKGRGGQNRAALNEYGVTMDTLERAARLWEDALRAGSRRASALQGGRADGTMDSNRYSLKEDQDYGRAREESREEFRRRWGQGSGRGFTIVERGSYACAYRGVARVQESAARVRQSLQRWGIDSTVVDGPVYVNKDGITTARPVREAATLQGMVFISNETTIPPLDTAGHEAYHAWKGTSARTDYTDTVRENLDYGSREFLTYQQKIAEAYFGGDVDLSDVAQLRKFEEELFAYISGHLNSGDYGPVLRAMFRDYDAVKAAWEDLVRENRRGQRLSLKTPVEQTEDLVALHNLTEDKLRSALRLGGFPMPSIAVTRADIPHVNFGDVTLVMDRRSVDPKVSRKNTVYSADAWTPTFPAIEYETDTQVERRISRRIGELSGQIDPLFQDDLRRIQYGLDDYLNRHGGEEGLIRWVMDNYGLKAAYLEEQGRHITAVTTQREAERGYNPERAEKYRAVAEALGTSDPAAIGSMNMKEMRDQHGEALEQAFPGMTKSAFRMSSILRQVQAFFSDIGSEPTYETVTDGAATRRAVDEALNLDGYERWVRELYAGIEADSGVYNNKERFTPSGNRRTFRQTHYPVTLDNITKAMAGQNNGNSRNVSGFYGVKSLRAGTARRFKSIADMHAMEGRLQNLTEEQAQAIADALDSRLSDIVDETVRLSPGGGSTSDYMQMDAVGNILMEIAEGGSYTIDSIMRTFNDEYGYRIGTPLATKIRDLLFDVTQMPVNLFEAKPERSVHFDEVLAAILPDSVGGGLSDDLLSAGVGQVLTYEAGNDADRLAKVNSVEGARFSLKSTDSQGRELTSEQREFFQDSKITDSEGRLLVLYHGTTAYGEITKFRRGRSGWLGPGIYLASRQSDARRYADAMGEGNGQIYELYANVTNPLVVTEGNPVPEILRAAYGKDSIYKSRSAKQSNDTRIITPADIKKLQSKGYDGIRWDFGGSTEVSVFSTEQIKRVDNQTPTSDPDIRRSLKGDILRENAALQEENALLRKRVDYWRGQTRRTQRATTDKKAVERTARELIAAYHADLETADVAAGLQSLYDYIAGGRDGNDELTYTEARRRADELARKLVEHAVVEDTEAYDDYSGLRQYLRTTPLSISGEDSSSIPDYGDFRRRNFGRIHLRKGPTNIDQVYRELSELWPEFFDEARESHPADQLVHIAEVLDGIYQVTERNPFAAYLSESVADASNEILERFFDLPQTRRTFADRAAARLDAERARGRRRVEQVRQQRDERLAELRRQNRERVQRTVQRERQTRERQLDRLKKRYAARDAAGRERRSARELRARISRHVGDLSRKLLRPSDKQHIPEQLRTAVATMLDAINLESVYTVDRSTGRRRKGGDGGPTKRTEAFRALRQAYAALTKEGTDYTLIVDPDLLDNLTELEAMRDTPLAEMSTGQLRTVWDTIRAVEASIRTANRVLGESRFRTISQVAEGIRSDNILRQDRGDYRGVLGKVDRLVNLDMLTPQGYFHRLGQTGDALFRMLRSAQDRHVEIMRSAQEATREIIGKLNVNELERETHTFDVDGEKLTLSTAQIMSLYELLKREQAREHIFVGGIRPETIQSGRGLRESRRSGAVHVGIEDLSEITGVLTEEQIRVADALQHYMGTDLSELGNQASVEVYGYRKFTEPNYFPISVDRNQTQKDIAKEAQAQTIAGRGFTKGTVPKANNAVMVGSIFDVFASHVNDMATYSAWLATMENVRRIRDFTFRDSEGTRTGTVKDIIERIFGRNGNAYLNKLIDDLNQGIRATGSGNFMDAIVGNYKAAAVAANLRVIAQQPTAILRALNTLDAKYLLAGTVKRGDWQKVMKYAPIARWKDWGYFDINTGRQMKDVLFDSDSRLEKVRQAGMAAAGRADSFSWARLWNAVEAETKDRRPGLKPGTDEFYRAVGTRFSEIVDQTQVVDGILQRSQIMRSPDGLTKMSTSFMGEPTKAYNMFVNALYDLRHATGQEGRRRAGKALARTSAALVVSFTINAVMQSLVDGLRDDDKELDYWERVLRAFTGFTGDEETFLDYWNSFWSGNLEASYNPLAYMPYFKDLVSIAQGFDVTRMDMEAVEKVFTAFTNMRKALTGEGRYTIAGASANMLAETTRMFGIPVANLKRDIRAVVTSAAIETDNYLLQYRMDKALLNMGYAGNRSGFLDILYAASINDPEAYEIIYNDMVSSGKITEEQIRTGMESRMKRDQGVTSAEELERRYLTPDQEWTYDRLYSQISTSPVWSEATTAQQEAVEEDLYNLAAGTDAGKKLQEKIDGGTAYGVTEADYLLYLAAREIADAQNEDPEKRNGSIDQAEAEAAIDMLTGLSDEARAYLWQSTNKGWKADNNPYN